MPAFKKLKQMMDAFEPEANRAAVKAAWDEEEAAAARPAVSADRDEQAAAERAARDAARAPFLAPERVPVAITRLAAREKGQVAEVAAQLGARGLAARPDLVFGIARVPDHIDGGLKGRSRLVEWEVVHTPAAGPAPAAPPAAAWLDAEETWVARRVGEPSVYDEDVALAYLTRAGIGPEQTLGISRFLAIHQTGDEHSSATASYVTGVHVWHPHGLGEGVLEALAAERPWPGEPVPGVHVEVFNWAAIRKVVHPETHRRFASPSPAPRLPSTPQELLCAYLDIVGLHPSDAYTAAVTEDAPKNLNGVTSKRGMTVTTNRGENQLCADGQQHPRLTGGARIVVAYRDRPAYAEGRARFASYEREVLRSTLAAGAERRPVEQQNVVDRMPGVARRMWKTAEFVSRVVDGESGDVFERLPPHRYCWPPQR
ncbi:MAG TPA: hypothetical protein VNT55_16885 [Baekduia sp.]|nr:hypothetical protein [Baekduia sp.]